jgi:fatty acid desaturase
MRDNLREPEIAVSRDIIELIVGFLMLLSGWIISFLLVLDLIPREFYLPLALIAYTISIMGLALAVHGFTGWLVVRVKKKTQ